MQLVDGGPESHDKQLKGFLANWCGALITAIKRSRNRTTHKSGDANIQICKHVHNHVHIHESVYS